MTATTSTSSSSSMTSTPPSGSDRAVEARLSALELKLGVRNQQTAKDAAGGGGGDKAAASDLESRLSQVQRTMEERTTPEYRSVWKESYQLLQDLDPGAGLTHQQQPLLYKRQEVLAGAETLQRDLNQLASIWHLLTTSTSSSSANSDGNSSISLDAVTQAPILTSNTSNSISTEDQRRLDALRVNLEDLNGRTRSMALKLNHFLETYHAVMSAASEKCILVDEVLAGRGK
jgi:hypothetical protein